MAHRRHDAERCAHESRRHFGNQFFRRIAIRCELCCEVAGEPRGVAGPVAKLMERGAVVVDLVAECGLRRNTDRIELRHIASDFAADLEACAGGRNQRFGAGNNLALRRWRS